MKVCGGETARTNLVEVPTKNPFFSITSLSMGGAKSTFYDESRKRVNQEPIYLLYGSIYGKCASSFDGVYLL